MTSTELPVRTGPTKQTAGPVRELRVTRRARSGRTNLTLGESPLSRVLALAALTVLAVVWLLPMSWALLTAFKSEADASDPAHWFWPRHGFTLHGFSTVWERGDLPLWMLNSLLISA